MPLGEIFIKEFNITSGQYSLLVSSYAFAAFVSSIIGIVFIDRFSRKRSLLTMYTGFAIGTLLCSFAESYYLLLTLRVFTGFFGGIISALVLSVISDLYAFKERGAAMGILFMSFSAASAFGIPIGIYLASTGSWETPFLYIGIAGILISVLVYFIFPLLDDHLKAQADSIQIGSIFKAIFGDINQVNALLTGFVLVLAHFMIIPFISPYMIRNVGLSQMEISYQFFFGGLATVISSPIIGKMTDKYGVMKVFIIVLFISFIPTLIITNLTFQPLWIAICFTTMFFVFASGRMISPNTIITAASKPANRGGFMSVKSALQQFAIGISAIISGQIVTINNSTGLYENYQYVGYISIILGISVIFMLRKIKVADGN
jgi:predicted MFS family arabinose efflux permease